MCIQICNVYVTRTYTYTHTHHTHTNTLTHTQTNTHTHNVCLRVCVSVCVFQVFWGLRQWRFTRHLHPQLFLEVHTHYTRTHIQEHEHAHIYTQHTQTHTHAAPFLSLTHTTPTLARTVLTTYACMHVCTKFRETERKTHTLRDWYCLFVLTDMTLHTHTHTNTHTHTHTQTLTQTHNFNAIGGLLGIIGWAAKIRWIAG